MINKEFVAIVLAVGLIMSIGIVLGQERIENIGGLGQKEEAGLHTPITEAYGGFARENFPKQEDDFETFFLPYVRPFDRYKIAIVGHPPDSWGIIECYNGIDFAGYITFISDEDFKTIKSGFGIYPKKDGVGEYFDVVFLESQYDEILNILRNENTLAAFYNSEYGVYGIVTTSTQQVGG